MCCICVMCSYVLYLWRLRRLGRLGLRHMLAGLVRGLDMVHGRAIVGMGSACPSASYTGGTGGCAWLWVGGYGVAGS